MRPLRFLSRNPLLVFAVLVVAFVGWIYWDAIAPPRAPEVPPSPSGLSRALPALADDRILVPIRLSPERTAKVLPKLTPGMRRTEVEGLVGMPSVDNISPATVTDGRVLYRTWYEADLSPPATVRPIEVNRRLRPPAPLELVTLEFDATKPGHPLVGIYYPDPLF